MMQSDYSRNYEVGYGKPPKHTRFRKGTSGNPRGRPKGSKSPRTSLEAAINETVIVLADGKRKKLTKMEAAFAQLANKAAKGDTRAIQLLVKLCGEYGLAPNLTENSGFYADTRTAEQVRDDICAKIERIRRNMKKSEDLVHQHDKDSKVSEVAAKFIESDDQPIYVTELDTL